MFNKNSKLLKLFIDLTEPERKVVRMWSDEAKDRNKKNEDEKNIIWRVRVSPRIEANS